MSRYELVPRISPEELEERVNVLAERINGDYHDKELVLVGVLKGAFVFLADLMRHLSIPLEVDFVRVASYGDSAESSGAVRLTKDIEIDIRDRDVLLVEDIIDTGLTIDWLLKHLQAQHPRSAKVCTLVDKFERREVSLIPDYVGIRMEKGFIVGYGLDFSEKHRNLPGIYTVRFLEQG
jgi:hypoxanthine phosphoribosyltransferase